MEFRRVLFRSRAPPRHSHGDPTSLPPHERLTDLAVVPREKPHTGAAAREQPRASPVRSEEHTSELQSPTNLVCRLLLEKKKKRQNKNEYRVIRKTTMNLIKHRHNI